MDDLNAQEPIIGSTAQLDRHTVQCDVQDLGGIQRVVSSHTRFGRYGRQGQLVILARNRVTLEQYVEAREAECDQLRGVLERMLLERACDCEQCQAEGLTPEDGARAAENLSDRALGNMAYDVLVAQGLDTRERGVTHGQ